MNIGVIGCGNISSLYLKAAAHFKSIRYLACSDLDMTLAKARAEEFGIEAWPVEKMLTHPEIELIVNLTVPSAHAHVAHAALEAGKHVYNEKPLATELSDAEAIVSLATRHNLRLASAPSTFLGAAVQSARKAIDEGLIGEPVAAHAAMLSHGMEHWHPNPEFFYQPGAGPRVHPCMGG